MRLTLPVGCIAKASLPACHLSSSRPRRTSRAFKTYSQVWLMKAVKLYSYCRPAVAWPRKRPRLCLNNSASGPASGSRLRLASKPFTSSAPVSKLGARRGGAGFVDNEDMDEDVHRARRQLDEMELDEDFVAAPPIKFEEEPSQSNISEAAKKQLLRSLRVIPKSPSYFSGHPQFTDDYVQLHDLLLRNSHHPTMKPAEVKRIQWLDYENYAATVREHVKPSRYNHMVEILQRLYLIYPQFRDAELSATLNKWASFSQRFVNHPNPIVVDEFGRTKALGGRKSSVAKAWVVEGDGQVLVNGMPIHQTFARVHDRDSVIWPLKATQRVDKYNVFALVRGGGTTGQAEALALAVSKALIAHEPLLKPVLRKVGCVARDPRRVERKKPGKLKARKMPAWVKR